VVELAKLQLTVKGAEHSRSSADDHGGRDAGMMVMDRDALLLRGAAGVMSAAEVELIGVWVVKSRGHR
jgi:hypothetical protein